MPSSVLPLKSRTMTDNHRTVQEIDRVQLMQDDRHPVLPASLIRIKEAMKGRFLIYYYVALGLIYLFLAAHRPVWIVPSDELDFFRSAIGITRGQWLGTYNVDTLVK